MTTDRLTKLKEFCKQNQGIEVTYNQLKYCSVENKDRVPRSDDNNSIPDLDNCIKQLIKEDIIKNLNNSSILIGDKFYINKYSFFESEH